ncbi:MAG: hypothetical protein ACRENC_04585 [Gemmatimonadaceae bacterium]
MKMDVPKLRGPGILDSDVRFAASDRTAPHGAAPKGDERRSQKRDTTTWLGGSNAQPQHSQEAEPPSIHSAKPPFQLLPIAHRDTFLTSRTNRLLATAAVPVRTSPQPRRVSIEP